MTAANAGPSEDSAWNSAIDSRGAGALGSLLNVGCGLKAGPAPDSACICLILPVRAQIFARIARSDGAHTCSAFLELSDKSVPKSTLSQHFKALREAGLIRSERKGVEMHNTPRCDEIDKRFPGLLAAIIAAQKTQNARRKKRTKTA